MLNETSAVCEYDMHGNAICHSPVYNCDGPNNCKTTYQREIHGGGNCGSGGFSCGYGHCIPVRRVCDGPEDCQSGADEQTCYNQGK